jgi:hypothetical protein
MFKWEGKSVVYFEILSQYSAGGICSKICLEGPIPDFARRDLFQIFPGVICTKILLEGPIPACALRYLFQRMCQKSGKSEREGERERERGSVRGYFLHGLLPFL